MDQALTDFLSKGTLIIAVLVVIINFFVRRIVLLIRPDFKPLGSAMDKKAMYSNTAAMWWNEIGLYALPVIIGANLGLFKGLSFAFDTSIKTASGRVFYAAIVGWFADFLYEVVQKMLYKSTGVTLPSAESLGSEVSVTVVHEDTKPAVTAVSVQVPPGPAPSALGGGEEPKDN